MERYENIWKRETTNYVLQKNLSFVPEQVQQLRQTDNINIAHVVKKNILQNHTHEHRKMTTTPPGARSNALQMPL